MAQNNRQVSFCRDCGQALSAGHSRVCVARRQVPNPQGGNNSEQRGGWVSDVEALRRRVQALEARPLSLSTPVSGASVEDMRVLSQRAPRDRVNRVFSLRLTPIVTNATAGDVFVDMPGHVVAGGATPTRANFFDISPTMPGFEAWASEQAVISITAVAVTYIPVATGLVGSGGLGIGFERANRAVAVTEVENLERFTPAGVDHPVQLRVTYGPKTPFERYLLGGPNRSIARPWGRVYLTRVSAGFLNPASQAWNGNSGFVRLHVQCACLRQST